MVNNNKGELHTGSKEPLRELLEPGFQETRSTSLDGISDTALFDSKSSRSGWKPEWPSDLCSGHLHVPELEGRPTAAAREHDIKVPPPSTELAQENVASGLLLQERQEGHLPGDDHPLTTTYGCTATKRFSTW
ncbi:hypothetical protein CEXT_584311 [Caerostris extrusa]|uniref:Prolactin receptor n=1 Tax=Caerostris extrusa TaxID=172846 RepID=A0AAV4N4C9_CAEEX|nr:hypothetical protein CEXT_584311 [Caerostris extrusa]